MSKELKYSRSSLKTCYKYMVRLTIEGMRHIKRLKYDWNVITNSTASLWSVTQIST